MELLILAMLEKLQIQQRLRFGTEELQQAGKLRVKLFWRFPGREQPHDAS